MKKQALEILKIAKGFMAEPLAFEEPDAHTRDWARKNLMLALRVDNSCKQIYESFLTKRNAVNNKFHYFAVWKSKTSECIGGNAFGRIGYNPKGFEISRGNEHSVVSAVMGKESTKQFDGYEPTEV